MRLLLLMALLAMPLMLLMPLLAMLPKLAMPLLAMPLLLLMALLMLLLRLHRPLPKVATAADSGSFLNRINWSAGIAATLVRAARPLAGGEANSSAEVLADGRRPSSRGFVSLEGGAQERY